MKHLSKSDSVLLLFFALSVISLLLCTHMFASTQRQNNYSIGINIAPSILCSIEIAKAPIEFDDIDLQEETPNIVENTDINTPYPKWVKIFDNRNSVFTNLVNIIDGKIVFENTRGDSTINTILGGPLTSEDVVFFRISNLSDAVELRCSLEDTGANGYSFVTSPTTTINSTEYVLTEIANGTPKVFYVYPNAWYQNQKLNFNINIEAIPMANIPSYSVTENLTNCTFDGEDTATYGTTYNATLSANPGCVLPSSINVTIGQTNYTVESGTPIIGINYTLSGTTGNISIAGICIVGNIVITCEATWDNRIATSFAGGSGESEDTAYLISTAEQLALLALIINLNDDYNSDGEIDTNDVFTTSNEISYNVKNCRSAFYSITADIDLNSGTTFVFNEESGLILVSDRDNTMYIGTGLNGTTKGAYYDTNQQIFQPTISTGDGSNFQKIGYGTNGELYIWTPIGTQANSFGGSIYGDESLSSNPTINGIYINNIYNDNIGLFGYTSSSANFGNLAIKGLVIGNDNVGGLVGYGLSTHYDGCENQDIVIGNDCVGGIVGKEKNSINAVYCINQGYVIGQNYVGGIVGKNLASTGEILECENGEKGYVYGQDYVGGICGSSNVNINTCTYINVVSGTGTNVGQICGNPKLDVSEEEIIEEEEE